MKDLTNKYKSIAINTKKNKQLISREHSTFEEARKDCDLMEESTFFDPSKYTTKVEKI